MNLQNEDRSPERTTDVTRRGVVTAALATPIFAAAAISAPRRHPPREGTVAASCRHDRMLAQVKVPVLLTHHSRRLDEATGVLTGALSDLQARKVGEIIKAAGQPFDYLSLPDAAHAMHETEPARVASSVRDWAKKLPTA
jgi:pimeloyl-ACP methyl ester carboxylesterase